MRNIATIIAKALLSLKRIHTQRRVTPRDRWAIVAYICALRLSQHATLADVPEEQWAALLNGRSP